MRRSDRFPGAAPFRQAVRDGPPSRWRNAAVPVKVFLRRNPQPTGRPTRHAFPHPFLPNARPDLRRRDGRRRRGHFRPRFAAAAGPRHAQAPASIGRASSARPATASPRKPASSPPGRRRGRASSGRRGRSRATPPPPSAAAGSSSSTASATSARLRCLKSETGDPLWTFEYPTDYEDLYNYSGGPRCCPVVDRDRVYIYGPEGMLHCLRAEDGKVIWKKDVNKRLRRRAELLRRRRHAGRRGRPAHRPGRRQPQGDDRNQRPTLELAGAGQRRRRPSTSTPARSSTTSPTSWPATPRRCWRRSATAAGASCSRAAA